MRKHTKQKEVSESNPMPTPKARRRYKWLSWGLIGFGVMAGVLAIVLASSPTLQENPHHVSSVANEEAPVAAKPKAEEVKKYTVAADLPKFIAAPKMGVDQARIKGLGITKNNQIAVPDNIYDAGWYNASAKPGQAGAMFIYGHVSSWEAHGLFYDLKKLKKGDTVTITRGDDKPFNYTVVSIAVYPFDKVPMDKVLAPVNAKQQGLNLMTCTGTVIKGTNNFSERLVVYMTLAS